MAKKETRILICVQHGEVTAIVADSPVFVEIASGDEQSVEPFEVLQTSTVNVISEGEKARGVFNRMNGR